MRRRLLAAIVAALALSAPAAAHVTAEPSFVGSGGTSTLSLTGPNERDEAMTGFAATAPSGVRIVRAHPVEGWTTSVVDGSTATWAGGRLASGEEATFTLELDVSARPGPLQLSAEQRYDGDSVVRWPVALTVVPGDVLATEPTGRSWEVIVVLGALVLLALATIPVAARRSRRRSLQER